METPSGRSDSILQVTYCGPLKLSLIDISQGQIILTQDLLFHTTTDLSWCLYIRSSFLFGHLLSSAQLNSLRFAIRDFNIH